MDFMTAAKTGFGKITDLSGTAGRSEYWWYVLAAIIANIIASFVLVMLGTLGALLSSLLGAALLIAATVRRLRDAGKPEILAYVVFGLNVLNALLSVVGFVLLALPLAIISLIAAVVMIFFLVQPSAGAAASS